jgi:SAM-dependent methyltransferase
MTNATQYHLSEFKIALDHSHPKHISPEIPRNYQVLDVGCGAGQTLIATCRGRLSFGIDKDMSALQLGRTLTREVAFACADAESLPFRACNFDMVISRVALPYTNIRRTLAEIHCVLKPGGQLWAVMHTFAVPWKAARRAEWKGRIFFAYVLCNSLVFRFTGRTFRLFRWGCESFQTPVGMTRALRAAGFVRIKVQARPYLIVTAYKSDISDANSGTTQ